MLGTLVVIEAGKVFGSEIIKEGAKELYNIPKACSPSPSDREIKQYLGESATLSEINAYREGHLSGWQKGLIVGGLIVLAGVAFLAIGLAASRTI